MELFYRDFGTGFPVVILHGLYGSSDNWTGIARELSENFRVIIPDQRNHGRSPHDPVHTYSALAEDLLELIIKLELDKFILAGHSMGGKAASWFSRLWPEKLSGLVIVDMTPFRSNPGENPIYYFHRKILTAMNVTDLDKFKSRDEANVIFDSVTSSVRIRQFLLKNITRTKEGRFKWKLNPAYLEKNLMNILDGFERIEKVLEPLSGFPVRFLRAGNSEYITEEDIPYILRLYPGAEIVTVNGASHWLHAEYPEVFIRTIREILDY